MRIGRANSLSGTKIKNLPELAKLIAIEKKLGKKIVFTNGCFDIFHWGHAMYLEQAKKKGDCLVVAVNNDSSVRRIKGAKRPIIGERDRINLLASLESVDYAVLFGEDTPISVIKEIRPDVLVKGADWDKGKIVGADFVRKNGGKIATIKLAKGRSTTALIGKIIEKFCRSH